MKIGFIGTGKLGMPCAEAIASKGHNVTGYDVALCNSHQVTMMSTIKDQTIQRCSLLQDSVITKIKRQNLSSLSGDWNNMLNFFKGIDL